MIDFTLILPILLIILIFLTYTNISMREKLDKLTTAVGKLAEK